MMSKQKILFTVIVSLTKQLQEPEQILSKFIVWHHLLTYMERQVIILQQKHTLGNGVQGIIISFKKTNVSNEIVQRIIMASERWLQCWNETFLPTLENPCTFLSTEIFSNCYFCKGANCKRESYEEKTSIQTININGGDAGITSNFGEGMVEGLEKCYTDWENCDENSPHHTLFPYTFI